MILTTPIKYGLPASPNACDNKICTDSAAERLVGITQYWKYTFWKINKQINFINHQNKVKMEKRSKNNKSPKFVWET
jgi:hypothetical protein